MRTGGLRLELRMVLDGDEPGMRGNFDDLDKRAIGTDSHGTHPLGLKLLAIGVVELVAVAVPLGDLLGTVALGSFAPQPQMGWMGPQPHRAALLGNTLLFFQQADYRMGVVFVEFRRLGLLEPK